MKFLNPHYCTLLETVNVRIIRYKSYYQNWLCDNNGSVNTIETQCFEIRALMSVISVNKKEANAHMINGCECRRRTK